MSAIIRTLTGKNKTGEVLFGIFDVLPIPPIHNIIRSAFKEKVPASQIPSYVWAKVDKLRLTTSAMLMSISYAVLKGWITLEEAQEFIKIIATLI